MSTTTHTPITQGELELYRVLHRANLLQYYETFISQGGDDVQQLCEAGEEEFLEIMALVGMAAKPLHVRRLQKALQEWVANPAAFTHLLPSSSTISSSNSASLVPKTQGVITITTTPPQQTTGTTAANNTPALSPGTGSSGTVTAQTWMPSSSEGKGFSAMTATASNGGGSIKDELLDKPSSPMPQITLMDSQIAAIESCAKELVKTLPPYSPKPMSMKKQINQDIMNVINIDFDDPTRMDEVRKYSAIYGRFDSKRKNTKPMSLHEICVNEAAAQICRYIPNLLTRRDELFPLARQVVRDSGYQYSKGHSRTYDALPGTGGSVKKPSVGLLSIVPGHIGKIGPGDELDKGQVRLLAERMTELSQDLATILQQQEIVKTKMNKAKDESNITLARDLQGELELLTAKQLQLLAEQSQIIKTQRRSEHFFAMKAVNENGDGTDSLHSGASSPQSSCISEEQDYKQTDFYTSPPKKSAAKTKMFVQKSLFDEGLRIAQQYGMADFAEEIADLKAVKKESDIEVDCDDAEVDSYNNDFRPVRVKKESSDEEGEKIDHRYDDQNGQELNLKRKFDNDENSQYDSRKYSCGVHGLKVEKLKIPLMNSGDDSLYHSEESCDSRVDSDVGLNRSVDGDFSTGASSNNNHKSEGHLIGSHLVSSGN